VAPFADQLRKLKPASAKGIYFRNAVLTTTMGPGVKVDLNS
jgi:large subunit ribosomal protein L1